VVFDSVGGKNAKTPDYLDSMVAAAEGTIFVGGTRDPGGSGDSLLIKTSSNGNNESSFASSGFFLSPKAKDASTTTPQGVKIHLVNETGLFVQLNNKLTKLTTTGGVEGAYGEQGIVANNTCLPSSVVSGPNQTLLLAGITESTLAPCVVRVLSSGAVDTSFGPSGNGMVTITAGSGNGIATALALDPDGSLRLGGIMQEVSGINSINMQPFFARLAPNGSPFESAPEPIVWKDFSVQKMVVRFLDDGGMVVLGMQRTNSTARGAALRLLRTDAAGRSVLAAGGVLLSALTPLFGDSVAPSPPDALVTMEIVAPERMVILFSPGPVWSSGASFPSGKDDLSQRYLARIWL